MWKSYKIFLKRKDRLLFWLIYPICCICIYVFRLWYLAPGLRAREMIDFYEVGSNRTEVNVFAIFITVLTSLAYFFTDYASLGELFLKKKGKQDFLRLSCKGKEVFLNAVKIDLLLKLVSLALAYGGMVLAELLIGARFHLAFRSLEAQGCFWLSGTVICFTTLTFVMTLSRFFPGDLKGVLFILLGVEIEGVLLTMAALHFWVVPVLMLAGIFLAAGNLMLAERRWKEGERDEESDS